MSFNSKKGQKIAYCMTPDKKSGVVYLDSGDLTGDIQVPPKGAKWSAKFGLLPNPNTRDVIYIAGPSGSGKSTIANSYIEEYCLMKPNNPVRIFSSIREPDESLSCVDLPNVNIVPVENLVKIDSQLDSQLDDQLDYQLDDQLDEPPENLDDQLEHLDNPFENPEYILEYFKDSLVLFDDIFNLPEETLDRVKFILKTLLETGRHCNCYVLITSHILLDAQKTKSLLNESTIVIFFPRSNKQAVIQYLKRYAGMKEQTAVNICNLNSRWVAYIKQYPSYIISSIGCFIP